MAIKKKSLIGDAAKYREGQGTGPAKSGSKPVEPAKLAATRKLAVAKLATAKLTTARLAFQKTTGG